MTGLKLKWIESTTLNYVMNLNRHCCNQSERRYSIDEESTAILESEFYIRRLYRWDQRNVSKRHGDLFLLQFLKPLLGHVLCEVNILPTVK